MRQVSYIRAAQAPSEGVRIVVSCRHPLYEVSSRRPLLNVKARSSGPLLLLVMPLLLPTRRCAQPYFLLSIVRDPRRSVRDRRGGGLRPPRCLVGSFHLLLSSIL